MQHQQTPAGPLTTPQAFRRSTGAHALLVSLVLADLVGLLLALLIGALLGPLAWWCLQELALVLHTSLPLDAGIVLLLCCIATATIRQRVLQKNAEDVWGCAGLLVVAFIVLAIVQTSWMTIPSPVIPAIKVDPIHWPLPLRRLSA